jgi:ubiquinone/menaquinone biosynthesis C-methylase UbiE
MEKRGAQDIVELDVQKSSALVDKPESKDHRLARGSVDKLPFKDKTFDFVLYPSGLAWRGDFPLLIPELVRVLKDNGRFVISVVHPFFEYLMNPRGGFRKNIGELFTDMKAQGFFIDELKEATLDETLRIVSLPPKLNKDLKRFQGMPILLLMRGILVRKKK